MSGFDPRRPYESTSLYESGGLYDGWEYKGPNPGPWKIELGADLSANGIGDWFTLDDPVKGELDNVTYLLAGEVFVDITRYARSLSVRRGRSRLLEKFITGQAEVRLDNRDRLFDPLMTGAPFTGQILPRKQLKISWNNTPVYTGNVSDWDYEYQFKDAVAVVKALDGFQYLATRNVPAQTMTQELTGDRIDYVLDQVGWPAGLRAIDSGTASVGADVVGDNVNALSYMQKVELSQNGLLFVSREGKVRFEDNYLGKLSGLEIGGASGVPFVDISVIYGSEELSNSITVEYLSGSVTGSLTLDDTASQVAYGTFENSYSTLLSASVDAEQFGLTLLNRFAQPTYRVESVEFNMLGLNTADREYMLDTELGDRVRLQFRPLNVGEVISRAVVVDAIEHDVTPSSHRMRLSLTDLGFSNPALPIEGGLVSEYVDGDTTWTLLSFTTPGVYDLQVGSLPITVEALIVAAGGGSGGEGGGGGGGLMSGSISFTTASVYNVEVGEYNSACPGGDSSIGAYVAFGGGMGGASGSAGSSGGSGGGGGAASPTFGLGGSATQTSLNDMTGYGNAGASAYVLVSGGLDFETGGGGGGAGGGTSTFSGGAGFSSSISGTSVTYSIGGNGLRSDVVGTQSFITPTPGSGETFAHTVEWDSIPHGVVFIRYESIG